MSFKDASKVLNAVSALLDAEQPRARNRTRINEVFNGNPPYSDQEARDNRLETNVNFLEGTRIIHNARQQFTNAFTKPANYFSVRLDKGPMHLRNKWGNIITKEINRIMKRSYRYSAALKSQLSATVLHGIGPVTWLRDTDWCPSARGPGEVLVPSGTLVSLENLSYFAIYTSFTAADLIRMTRGEGKGKGWNMQAVNTVLAWLAENTGNPLNTGDWNSQYFPESVEEDFKENSGFWGSDAVPVIKAFDFYFLDTNGDTPTWRRRIVIDPYSGTASAMGDNLKGQFLFDGGNRSYGEDIHQLMHVQFADGAVVPPFRWHSVRSLGYLLYAICHLQNRLRCRFNDAVFEQMMWLFRIQADSDQERLEKVDLFHTGVIPDGLSWVPQAERHVVDGNLLNAAMAQHRQLMSESSASYTQDPDTGTAKELTATEVMARVNSSNAIMGSMLAEAYNLQVFQYREIARRFSTLDHEDCKKFRARCVAAGVDESVLTDVECWDIDPERVMGSGNKMLEIAQADRLMAVRPLLPPESQAQVVHMYVEANTDDPKLADHLIPTDMQRTSEATEKATLAWGTLIDGKPVVLAGTMNRIDYLTTLMQMLAADISQFVQAGQLPELKRIMGMANVIDHCEQQIQILAQDNAQGDLIKTLMDALGGASNEIKGFIQRIQEQQAQAQAAGGPELDPETQAKIQSMLITAQSKAQIAEANAAQKRQQKEIAFQQDQARKDAATLEEAKRAGARTQAEIAAMDIRTAADVTRQ